MGGRTLRGVIWTNSSWPREQSGEGVGGGANIPGRVFKVSRVGVTVRGRRNEQSGEWRVGGSNTPIRGEMGTNSSWPREQTVGGRGNTPWRVGDSSSWSRKRTMAGGGGRLTVRGRGNEQSGRWACEVLGGEGSELSGGNGDKLRGRRDGQSGEGGRGCGEGWGGGEGANGLWRGGDEFRKRGPLLQASASACERCGIIVVSKTAVYRW